MACHAFPKIPAIQPLLGVECAIPSNVERLNNPHYLDSLRNLLELEETEPT